jgi:hypothetical protein
MTKLRRSIIFILAYLFIIFNLERLNIGQESVVGIQFFVLALIVVAIAVIIVFPKLSRIPRVIIFVGLPALYLLGKLIIFNQRPFLGGINANLSIAEIAVIIVGAYLALQLSDDLHEMENIIEKVTIPQMDRKVFTMNEATDEIKTEFVRSRRHNRPLSVVVVEPMQNELPEDIQRTVHEIQQTMMERYVTASLAQMITKEARRTDLVVEEKSRDHERFIVLCPETPSEGSAILADRIRSSAMNSLGISVACGIASFPTEALTFEELLHKAEINLLRPSGIALDSLVNSGKSSEAQVHER